jgi:hypothetical protein
MAARVHGKDSQIRHPYGATTKFPPLQRRRTRAHPILELFGPALEPFGDPAKMNDPRITS